MQLFSDYDERALLETHAFHDDEGRMIQTAQAAASELAGLMEADRRNGAKRGSVQQTAAEHLIQRNRPPG